MTSDSIRALLEAKGYEVRFHEHVWVECLILGEGESWFGRGADRAEALRHAVSHACPSELAMGLLKSAAEIFVSAARTMPLPAITSSNLPSPAATPPPPPSPSLPPAAPPDDGAGLRTVGADEARTLDLETIATSGHENRTEAPPPMASVLSRNGGGFTLHSSQAAVAADPAEDPNELKLAPPDPYERTPGQIAVIISRPSFVPRAPPSIPVITPATSIAPVAPVPRPAPVPPDPKTAADIEAALEELDILMDRIRDSREELGLCAPDRQRLAMLAWICEARSHTDTHPDEIRIRERVGAISRELTDIGKTFWPGSVTALQLHMQPRDLPRHLLGGTATTWLRASELAEQQLRNRELEDERKNYDGYGWADAKATIPRPNNPDALLEETIGAVERGSGSIATQAIPTDPNARPDAESFTRWVRQLRWLRGADVDPDRWARLAGRLRWWAFRREPTLAVGARELEPSFIPPTTWAALLGHDPEQRRLKRKLREVLGTPLTVREAADKNTLIAWLARALPFGDTHHNNIVKLMEPHKDAVLSLVGEDFPDADRRLRRRLQKLQEDLRGETHHVEVEALPDDEAGEEEHKALDHDSAPEPPPPPLPEELLVRVRGVTAGKRSVFVSNRRDPELQARLQSAFAFASLDCKIAEPRRVQTLGEAIEEGQYDFVLAATGFQSHSMDNVLARACRKAGVQYVRVNRGRPLACLRAIARELS